jgi:peroxiredoxin
MTATISEPSAPISAGKLAPVLDLRDSDGNLVHLSSVWEGAQNGAVVVFLRHFGCIFCRQHLVQLRGAYAEFQKRGVAVVAIGVGSVQDASELKAWLKLPFPLLADPEQEGYRAYGLERGSLTKLANPKVIAAGFKAMREGNKQVKATGDPKQLPGTFVVDQYGMVRHAHPATHAGDLASVPSLLAAIDAYAKDCHDVCR